MDKNTSSHSLSERLDSLDARLAVIERNLERQKGFIGGIIFVFGILAYFVSNLREMVGWFK